MKRLYRKVAGLCLLGGLSTGGALQAGEPVLKVDFDMSGRQTSEVTEPGYTAWAVPQGLTATKTLEGVTFTLKAVNLQGTDNVLRSGWAKALVQSPYYARLVNDGLSFDRFDGPGDIEMRIQGLPVGTHLLQTFHNSWRDTVNYDSYPINIALNGRTVHSGVVRSRCVTANSAATVLSTPMEVTAAGQEMVLLFSIDTTYIPNLNKKYIERSVCINGFELNTAQLDKLAFDPTPTDQDWHVDADSGSCLLQWHAAPGAAKHVLYVGTDRQAVTRATGQANGLYRATLEAGDTCFALSALYNLNTYYWRVDEVDASGHLTTGNVWSFRPRHLAFRGAEGYGRYATGGRGGKVVYVTNLNDDGPGSFREAVTNDIGPRTILFAVGGRIQLKGRLTCSSPYVTVAGQTAPGKGICVSRAPYGIGPEGICRFMRFRVGAGTTYDGLGMAGGDHSIADHCSVSWTIDEAFSSRGAKNITLQRTLISEALNVAGHDKYPAGTAHGYAATIGGDVGSFHHNLLAHCEGRNWSMGGGLDGNGYYMGRLDLFNNVCYNWGGRATDGGAHEVNFVNNYYKKGLATTQYTILIADLEGTGKGTQSYYYAGNVIQNVNGSFANNGTSNTNGRTYRLSNGQVLDWQVFRDKPFFPSYATIEPAQSAYKSVLADVGCNLPLFDEHDQRMVKETLTGTYKYVGSITGKKGLIDNESDAGGFEDYPEVMRAADFDSDLDGLPDWWELLHGTNAHSPAGDFTDTNADADHDGYTALDDYLEWMAVPHFYLNGRDTLDLSAYGVSYTQSPVYTAVCEPATASFEGAPAVVSFEGANAIVVPAKGFKGIAYMDITIGDATGCSYTRRMGLCVEPADKPEAGPLTPDADGDLIGWATYNDMGQNGTTGGGGGEVVRVKTRADLVKYAAETKPYTILVEGNFTGGGKNDVSDMISVESHKSIIGAGEGATFDGIGFNASGKQNIIFRNLTITHAKPDAIALRETHHVWVDHCDLSDSDDGLLDFTMASNYMTVSWTHFHNHDKVALANSGTQHFEDNGREKVTYHHNWFDHTVQRNPRVGYGMGHVFNNYYSNVTSYCVGYHTGASVRVENNSFYLSNNPLNQMYTSVATAANYAQAEAVGNVFEATTGNRLGTGAAFLPELYYNYRFRLDEASSIKALVPSKVGPQAGVEYEFYPTPGNGAVDVQSVYQLTWSNVEKVTSWELSLGTDTTAMTKATSKYRVYSPGALLPDTTYYWQVRAIRTDTVLTGPLWRFRTAPLQASKPFPADGELHAPLYEPASAMLCSPLTLRWKPGYKGFRYKVYLGEQAELTEADLKGTVTTAAYEPGILKMGIRYYWRVNTLTGTGEETVGKVWTFTSDVAYCAEGDKEAETMVLCGRAFKEEQNGTWFKASNNWVVSGESGPGTMSALWNAPDAQCTVAVSYFDESDGNGGYRFCVNGNQVAKWTTIDNTDAMVDHVIPGVTLHKGDELSVHFYTDGGELNRTDMVKVKVESLLGVDRELQTSYLPGECLQVVVYSVAGVEQTSMICTATDSGQFPLGMLQSLPLEHGIYLYTVTGESNPATGTFRFLKR